MVFLPQLTALRGAIKAATIRIFAPVGDH